MGPCEERLPGVRDFKALSVLKGTGWSNNTLLQELGKLVSLDRWPGGGSWAQSPGQSGPVFTTCTSSPSLPADRIGIDMWLKLARMFSPKASYGTNGGCLCVSLGVEGQPFPTLCGKSSRNYWSLWRAHNTEVESCISLSTSTGPGSSYGSIVSILGFHKTPPVLLIHCLPLLKLAHWSVISNKLEIQGITQR